jgi:hypothetical protein
VEKHDHDFEDIDLRDRFETFAQEMVEEKNLREMLARGLEKAVERLTARLDKIRITDEIRASQKRQEVLAEVRPTPAPLTSSSCDAMPVRLAHTLMLCAHTDATFV